LTPASVRKILRKYRREAKTAPDQSTEQHVGIAHG
jgi:hypothetical protein